MLNIKNLKRKRVVKLIWGILVMVSITFLVLHAANDMIIKLTDAAGTSNFAIQDSAASDVFRVDSDGNTEVLKGAELRIYEGASTYYTGFEAPLLLTSNIMYALPTGNGSSGQLLTTNGSGTLSWSTVTTAPRNLDRKWFMVNSAAATMAAVGIAAPTNGGTLSNSNDTDSTYTNFATAATANTAGGITSTTYTLLRRQHNPYFSATIRTAASIANMRILVGLTSAAPASYSNDPGNSVIMFRYATGVDGNWYACTRDGSTLNAVSTGVAVATSTEYNLEITTNSAAGTAKFTINGTDTNTLNTNLPAAATDLGFTIRVQTTEAVAKSVKISRVFCEID